MKTGPRIPRILSKLDRIFARNLKQQRGEQSQLQFSKTLKVAQSTLNRIENGRASVTLSFLEKVANALKIEPVDLLKDKRDSKGK